MSTSTSTSDSTRTQPQPTQPQPTKYLPIASGPGGPLPHLGAVSRIGATFLVGLAAGFFYTYEASITPALAEVDDLTYVTTFQSINETIRNPVFGTVFFGSIVALAVAVVANWNADRRTRMLVGAAAALYLATVVITVTANVPLNNELGELVDVSVDSASGARADFEADWNRFNLIRTLPVVASFLCLIVLPFLGGKQAASE